MRYINLRLTYLLTVCHSVTRWSWKQAAKWLYCSVCCLECRYRRRSRTLAWAVTTAAVWWLSSLIAMTRVTTSWTKSVALCVLVSDLCQTSVNSRTSTESRRSDIAAVSTETLYVLTAIFPGWPGLARPRAGSGVVRIDPLHFLAGCRTRRLNQI